MEVFDPGDPQGGERTSTTHDQHDPGKVEALEEKDGRKLKEIGAKTNKNNKNGQIASDYDEAEEDKDKEEVKTEKRQRKS